MLSINSRDIINMLKSCRGLGSELIMNLKFSQEKYQEAKCQDVL